MGDEYKIVLTAGEDNIWQDTERIHTWDNLQEKEEGEKINYTVREVNVPDGYEATYENEKKNDGKKKEYWKERRERGKKGKWKKKFGKKEESKEVIEKKKVEKVYTNFEINASTQMHNHNNEQIKLLKEIGINKIVLDRELSLDEINKLDNSIEKEVFIHGALCNSYRGCFRMAF